MFEKKTQPINEFGVSPIPSLKCGRHGHDFEWICWLFKRLDILLVVFCIFVTLGVFAESRRIGQVAAHAEFQRLTEDGLQALKTRLDIYLQSLNGAAGMLHASENIESDDFEIFASTIDIKNSLPGINGIGFIEPVPKDEVAEFVAKMRADGTPDFSAHPETDSDVKYLIKYIAPVDINAQAVGLDISFEEGRREAANRARETGLPQITPRILLVQDETAQPGFLILKPYFRDEELRGWVYAPFIGRNLMGNLSPGLENYFDFQVYDGNAANPDTLIYATEQEPDSQGTQVAKYSLEIFGRPWTLEYQSTKFFDTSFNLRGPYFILLGGLLLSVMLAFAMRALRARNESLAEIAALRGKQISAREEENRSLVENTVVAVIILDEDLKILFANHAATTCFGGEREGLSGLPLKNFVTEIPKSEMQKGYNALGHTLEGRELYLDLQTNRWVTLNGKRRTTVIVRDVTANVEVVDELAVTKQRFDAALSGSQIGVFEINLKTGTSVVSHTWRDIMGVDQDAEDPQGIFMNRIHPDDLPILFEVDRKCINGETDRSISEYRMGFGDSWRWMKSDAVVVERDADGKAARMVGTQIDVTDLRHGRNALEASEQRFRTVQEAAPVGMATLNNGGYFIGVNSAMCDLTGYSRDEMLKDFNLSKVIPENEMGGLIDAVQETMKSGIQDIFRGEFRILHKDGGHRWGFFNVTWTFDKNAGSYVFIAQVIDITDKKKIDQIKSEFISTVSHELRTPLTSIKGALGLIEVAARDKLPASSLRLIEIARSNSNRLTDIVNDILDLEKISSGEISFNMVEVDLGELIRSSHNEMLPFAVTHKSTLVVELPEEELHVIADSGRMMQVMANLISNACKYSYDGTEVKITVEKLDKVAIVYVQNIGKGVPESFKGRIFQRFSQADGSDTRANGGTGLGLNISRQIVWRQGGDIGFESKPDGPTVFWFTCQIVEPSRKPAPPAIKQLRTKKNERLKVLHLEDDEDFAEVIRAGLKPYADVQNVTRLKDVRAMLSDGGPWDVIILDWTLPDGDAAVLLKEIVQQQPDARLVSLSSDGVREKDDRISVHIIKAQADMDYIIESVMDFSQKAS